MGGGLRTSGGTATDQPDDYLLPFAGLAQLRGLLLTEHRGLEIEGDVFRGAGPAGHLALVGDSPTPVCTHLPRTKCDKGIAQVLIYQGLLN